MSVYHNNANFNTNPSVMDITGNRDEIEILLTYDYMCQKCQKNLCELTFLQEFPQTSTEDNLRYIIKYMLNKYAERTCIINEQPNLLIEFTFKFRMENAQVRQIKLSNHMQFRNDILMICYMKYFLLVPKILNKRYKVLRAMMLIMVTKYDIDISSLYPGPYAITFTNISIAYLSISLDMIYYAFSDILNIPNLFPYFDLPVMIYTPLTISILPMLNDLPIAILLVIFLVTYEICLPQIVPNISLIIFYELLQQLLINNTKTPEKLKLYLCMKYNIIILEGDKFKFAPCFTKYRQKAKNIISEKRPNDPHLKNILSVI